MTNSQTWLNNNYPLQQRGEVRKLLIWKDVPPQDDILEENDGELVIEEDNSGLRNILNSVPVNNQHFPTELLTGKLDLSGFVNLRELYIDKQLITELDISGCSRLKKIKVENNYIREINFPLTAPQLTEIRLENNNISARDLSCFANFTNLKALHLGTDDRGKIHWSLYNRWNGSLSLLRNLTKLEDLGIDATDVDSGLEELPTNRLVYISFDNKGRVGAGVDRLKETLGYDADWNIFQQEYDAGDDMFENMDGVIGTILTLQSQNQVQVNNNNQ